MKINEIRRTNASRNKHDTKSGELQSLVERASLRETENIGDAVREARRCTSSLNRTGNIAVQFRSPRFKKKKKKVENRSRRSSYRPTGVLFDLAKEFIKFCGRG